MRSGFQLVFFLSCREGLHALPFAEHEVKVRVLFGSIIWFVLLGSVQQKSKLPRTLGAVENPCFCFICFLVGCLVIYDLGESDKYVPWREELWEHV